MVPKEQTLEANTQVDICSSVYADMSPTNVNIVYVFLTSLKNVSNILNETRANMSILGNVFGYDNLLNLANQQRPLNTWLQGNKLSLNVAKTHSILYTTKPKRNIRKDANLNLELNIHES